MQIKEKVLFSIITIILPLIIGGVLYYILCPDVYFVTIIDDCTNINMHVEFDVYENILLKTLRNYLFDYLWAYAFTNALYLVCNNSESLLPICIISVLVGGVLEVLQHMGIISGTIDILDILFEAFGTITATFMIKSVGEKEK